MDVTLETIMAVDTCVDTTVVTVCATLLMGKEAMPMLMLIPRTMATAENASIRLLYSDNMPLLPLHFHV